MGFANGYQTTTTAGLTSGATSVTVASTTGIPRLPFTATIAAEGANTDEIVQVTANAAGTLTIVRAFENFAGIGASAHASGAIFAATVTAGYVDIPGNAAPDRVPLIPNAADEEFDALTGWSTYGTLDTNNVTDVTSHWHGKRVLGGASMAGIYRAMPVGGMPFTATLKMPDGTCDQNNEFFGVMLLEASPGKATFFGGVYNSGSITYAMYRWTNATTFATSVNGSSFGVGGILTPLFPYTRIIVASSTDVTLQVSQSGDRWRGVTLNNQNPSLTVANVGVCIGNVAAATTVEAYCDFLRFT